MATEPDATVSPDITERWDANDPSLILTLVKRNLTTLITRAKHQSYGGYDNGGPSVCIWTSASKSALDTAIANAQNVANSASTDPNEYLTAANEIFDKIGKLEHDRAAENAAI